MGLDIQINFNLQGNMMWDIIGNPGWNKELRVKTSELLCFF